MLSHVALDLIDRPHLPERHQPDLALYKEWYHFNVVDETQGVDLIVNLSLDGDIYRPGHGEAKLIVLTCLHDDDWRGGVDVFDAAALNIRPNTVDITLGEQCVRFNDGRYDVRAALRDESVAVKLNFKPVTEPMLVWNDTPVGSGHINWLIVPCLQCDGSCILNDRVIDFKQARAYHDHNWGYWRWGEDFGWEWGFSSALARRANGQPLSLVFDRTTNRQGALVKEHTLVLWDGPQLGKLFTRRALKARRCGRFAGKVRRIPATMNLLCQGEVLSVPEKMFIQARDGKDWLAAEYRVKGAVQIAVPGDLGFGVVELNETFGTLSVTGELDGEAIDCAARACFEFMG